MKNIVKLNAVLLLLLSACAESESSKQAKKNDLADQISGVYVGQWKNEFEDSLKRPWISDTIRIVKKDNKIEFLEGNSQSENELNMVDTTFLEPRSMIGIKFNVKEKTFRFQTSWQKKIIYKKIK